MRISDWSSDVCSSDLASMSTEGPRVFLVAGEPSGDALAAPLIAALRQELGPGLEIAGIGGERLAAEGLRSRFPMDDVTLMGMVEVLDGTSGVYGRSLSVRVDRGGSRISNKKKT